MSDLGRNQLVSYQQMSDFSGNQLACYINYPGEYSSNTHILRTIRQLKIQISQDSRLTCINIFVGQLQLLYIAILFQHNLK